jgi:hypothetical protein
MAFTVTKISDTLTLMDNVWLNYNEGIRIQAECSHLKKMRWSRQTDKGEHILHVCDECGKQWSEIVEKGS